MNYFDENFGEYLTENRSQHELMGAYIDMMTFSLKKWDSIFGDGNGDLGDDYYRAMAFGGLFRDGTNTPTDSFMNQVPDETERNKILEILFKEQNGTIDAKGKKCD
jgi:hypothetical protein